LIQVTRDVSLKRALILDELENLTDLITQAHRYAHCNEVLLSIWDHDNSREQDKARKARQEPDRRENMVTRRRKHRESCSRDKRPRARKGTPPSTLLPPRS